MKRLQPRIDRLEKLSRGLAREAESWANQMDGLHFAERNAYVDALRAAARNLQDARIALVEARQRIEH